MKEKLKELKLKYTANESDKLFKILEIEVKKAKEDYKRKKLKKGEKVDYWKMENAINQRKKLKELVKLCLASVFSCGNILDKPAVNRTIEKLEREARNI